METIKRAVLLFTVLIILALTIGQCSKQISDASDGQIKRAEKTVNVF